ncbi:MAG: EAL domain-containing protein [Actinomycetota bacterium]
MLHSTISRSDLVDMQPSRHQWRNAVDFARVIGELLHELQKERGASAVFLSSDGARFADELLSIRRLTDEVLEQFAETASRSTGADADDLELARDLLRDLIPIRDRVDACSIGAARAIDYYTDLNQALLLVVASFIAASDSTLLRTRLVSLLALMRAKELAGVERAVVAQVIGADRFDPSVNVHVVALISAQEALMRIFDQAASPELQAMFAKHHAHPASVRTKRMETEVLVNGVGDFGMDAGDWFLAMTQRIDLLQRVERSQLDELDAIARDGGGTHDAGIDEALDGAVGAMREIRKLVDAVRNGENSLRELVRGRRGALDSASQELAAAQRTASSMAALAINDVLTGLPNRAISDDLIRDALSRSAGLPTSVAVMTIDLDHFKLINDSLGHAAGDQLLQQLATRLRRCMRSTDTVARVGGDEFLVISEPVSCVDEGARLGQRILDEMDEPFEVAGRRLQISLSIGVAVAEDGTEADDLLRNSDLAAYRAKALGRARVELFDDDLRRTTDRRHEVERGLRQAMARDELRPWFQPIVDLETGWPIASEALVRWYAADGVRAAGTFIDVAEATGLLPTMSERVLQRALSDRPSVAGHHPAVSVNVVAANLLVPAFPEIVEDSLDEHGVEPGDLWIEVTERAAVSDDRAVETLRRLRRLGCTIALDDFGTGFSALSCLRSLPLDVVKLDGSFLDGLGNDRQTDVMVESLLRIVSTMGMRSVAEGVEDLTQLDQLREMGCDMAQGYAIGRPAPDASEWACAEVVRSADTPSRRA